MTTECAIDGCNKERARREWCNKHYTRWLKYGDPGVTLRAEPHRIVSDLCRVDGCYANRHRTASLCGWHGKHGEDKVRILHRLPSDTPPDIRVALSTTITSSGCWEWNRSIDGRGYGTAFIEGRAVRAHRFAYEFYVGPIPDGLQLDHLCRVRSCVNPEHLEPVQQKVNILRGVGLSAKNAKKTHCKHGHEFTPENTYIRTKKGAGHRRCRTCQLATQARGRAKKANQLARVVQR